MNFFNVNYVWRARVIRVAPARLRSGLRILATHQVKLLLIGHHHCQLWCSTLPNATQLQNLITRSHPFRPPRGLSHTFWSVQRWEIGLNKEGLHSAK